LAFNYKKYLTNIKHINFLMKTRVEL
jgi:hypothetical protein